LIEVPLGKGFVLKVTFSPGQRENLVELWDSSENLVDEQIFTKDFWRKQRKEKNFKKWLSDNLEDTDYGTLSDDSFKDVKLEISRGYRGEDTSEMPSEEEFDEEKFDENVIEKANEIVESGETIPYLVKIMGIAGHKRDYARKILMVSSSLSKMITGKAINDYAVGETGKGKSHLMRVAFECIPNEYKIDRGSISPLYLYYMTEKFGEDCLSGRVLFYDDVSLNPEKETTIKAVTDPDFNDEITHGTVQNQEPVDLNIDGLPTVWLSSVDMIKNEQVRDRFFIDQPEESESLDKKVAEHQKYHGRRGTLSPEAETDFSVARAVWKKVAEETKDLNVLIPFDYDWEAESSRRLQPFFLAMIYTVAKTNYKKRLIVGDSLFATPEDFYITKFVFNSFLRTTATQMTKRQFDVLKSVPEEREKRKSRADIVEDVGISYGKVRYDLDQLADSGFVNAEKESGEWVYWKTGKGAVTSCGRLKKESMESKGLKKEFNRILTDCEKIGTIQAIESEGELEVSVGNETVTINPGTDSLFDQYLRTVNEYPVLEKISQLEKNVLDYCPKLFEVPEDSEFGSQLFTILKPEKEEEEESITADMLREEEPEPLYEKAEKEEEEEPDHLCEECREKMGIDDKPAVDKFPMGGKEKWLCEDCARDAGFLEGYT